MTYLRTLIRDRRGTASIEAAVMLPLMGLCWVALFFRFQGIEKEMEIAVEARRDAWVFSAQGCEVEEGSEIPKGIGLECNEQASWMSAIENIPFVGFLITTFAGFELSKTARVDHTAPPLLGGGTTTLAYPYSLMCNEKSRTADYLLKSCICEQVSAMGLSLSFAVDCPKKPPRDGANCPK
jgi:hypothetical protein